MKKIRIAPLDYMVEEGISFEIKAVDNHTVDIKVSRGEKYRVNRFDLSSFNNDEEANHVIGMVLESMTDYVQGIEP